MKMAKWYLTEQSPGTLMVLKGDPIDKVTELTIFKTKWVQFTLLTSADILPAKTVGYKFTYANRKDLLKFQTFNSFAVFYNKEFAKKYSPRDAILDILYEDQIIRLLAYRHKNSETKEDPWSIEADYLLVGRWKTENEAAGPESE